MSRVLCLLMMLLGCLSVQAKEQLDDFRLQGELTLEGGGPWYRMFVPMSVQLGSAHGDLRDVRIFNGEGEVLPYTLLTGLNEPIKAQRREKAKVFPLYGNPDSQKTSGVRVQRNANQTVVELTTVEPHRGQMRRGWLLDLTAIDFPVERLYLNWKVPLDGFQRFTVEASDDLLKWQPWGEGQIAYLRHEGQRVEKREVELLGPSKANYLRLVWQKPLGAIALDSVEVAGTLSSIEPSELIWTDALTPEVTEEGHYLWNLPQTLQVARVRIEVSDVNTVAPAKLNGRVFFPDVKPRKDVPWRLLSSSVLYRLVTEDGEKAREELPLSGRPVNQLQLELDRRGATLGEKPPKLYVAVDGSEIVFLGRKPGPFRLGVGNQDVASAALPLTTLIPDYESGRWSTFGIAKLEQALEGESVAVVESEAAFDWKRFALWSVLLGGVALLILMAYSLLYSLNKKS